MQAIFKLACHPALSTKWLDWVTKGVNNDVFAQAPLLAKTLFSDHHWQVFTQSYPMMNSEGNLCLNWSSTLNRLPCMVFLPFYVSPWSWCFFAHLTSLRDRATVSLPAVCILQHASWYYKLTQWDRSNWHMAFRTHAHGLRYIHTDCQLEKKLTNCFWHRYKIQLTFTLNSDWKWKKQ